MQEIVDYNSAIWLEANNYLHYPINACIMHMSASVKSNFGQHEITVETNNDSKGIAIAAKANGYGSSVNGGELLLLALATCFCNDIYREAHKRNIAVSSVEVICEGEFGAEGEPGKNFSYKATVAADVSPAAVEDMILHVDSIAEVHNTLRKGATVVLKQ